MAFGGTRRIAGTTGTKGFTERLHAARRSVGESLGSAVRWVRGGHSIESACEMIKAGKGPKVEFARVAPDAFALAAIDQTVCAARAETVELRELQFAQSAAMRDAEDARAESQARARRHLPSGVSYSTLLGLHQDRAALGKADPVKSILSAVLLTWVDAYEVAGQALRTSAPPLADPFATVRGRVMMLAKAQPSIDGDLRVVAHHFGDYRTVDDLAHQAILGSVTTWNDPTSF